MFPNGTRLRNLLRFSQIRANGVFNIRKVLERQCTGTLQWVRNRQTKSTPDKIESVTQGREARKGGDTNTQKVKTADHLVEQARN